jgi:cell division septation protein DedD
MCSSGSSVSEASRPSTEPGGRAPPATLSSRAERPTPCHPERSAPPHVIPSGAKRSRGISLLLGAEEKERCLDFARHDTATPWAIPSGASRPTPCHPERSQAAHPMSSRAEPSGPPHVIPSGAKRSRGISLLLGAEEKERCLDFARHDTATPWAIPSGASRPTPCHPERSQAAHPMSSRAEPSGPPHVIPSGAERSRGISLSLGAEEKERCLDFARHDARVQGHSERGVPCHPGRSGAPHPMSSRAERSTPCHPERSEAKSRDLSASGRGREREMPRLRSA